jgi:methionyl aminopeptidase
MRRAGHVVAEMHDRIRAAIRPGVSTAELDQIGRDVLDRRSARSNFLGYHGYPAVTCISVNEQVVHGIPGPRRLEDGDVVSVDCGAIVEGWHGDAAFTTAVGEASDDARRLIEITEAALDAAVRAMVPGARLGDVGAAVEHVATAAGFDVVRAYCGHGIGRAMHEEPDVPNYGRAGRGARLSPGNTLAVEPMVVTGRGDVRTLGDHWTVVTVDGGLAAHAEHTVLVGEHGPEILTI